MEFEELVNNEDKASGKMNILVNKLIENNVNDKVKESEEIICPIWDENNIFRIKDYKISMECKNNHKHVDLSIKDFINSQKIDISKYKCNTYI